MDAESDPTACTTSPPVSTRSPMAAMVEALDAHMKSNIPADSMLTPRDMNCPSSAPPPPLLPAHARQDLESSSSSNSNSTGCSCSSHIQPAVRCKHEPADQKHEPTEEATALSMILPTRLPVSVDANFCSSKDTAPEQNHSTACTVPEHSDPSRFDPTHSLPSTTPPSLSSEAVTTGPEHSQPRQLSTDANKTFSAAMTTVVTTSTTDKGTIPKEPWIGAGVVASLSKSDSPIHNSDTWATASSPMVNTSTTTSTTTTTTIISSTDPTPAPMSIPALNVHGLQDHSHSPPTTPSSATSPVSSTSSSRSILSSSSLSEYLVIGQSQEPLEREDSESDDRRSDRSFPDSVQSRGHSSSNDVGNSSGSGSESLDHPYSSRSARTSARHMSHAQSGADSGSDHSRDSQDSVSDPQIRAPRPTRPYHRHRHQDIHGASGHRPSTPSPPSPPLQSPSPSSRPPHSYPHQQTGFSRRRDAYEEGYLPELVQERRRARQQQFHSFSSAPSSDSSNRSSQPSSSSPLSSSSPPSSTRSSQRHSVSSAPNSRRGGENNNNSIPPLRASSPFLRNASPQPTSPWPARGGSPAHDGYSSTSSSSRRAPPPESSSHHRRPHSSTSCHSSRSHSRPTSACSDRHSSRASPSPARPASRSGPTSWMPTTAPPMTGRSSSSSILPSASGVIKSVLECMLAAVVCVSLLSCVFMFSYVSTGSRHLLEWYSDQKLGQRIRDGFKEREHLVQEALEKMAGEDYIRVKRKSRQPHHHQQQPPQQQQQQQQQQAGDGYQNAYQQYYQQQQYQKQQYQQKQQQQQAHEEGRLTTAEWQDLIRAASMSFMNRFTNKTNISRR